MAFLHCTDDDRRIIGEALKAAVEGPFFPEWEFQTIFGLTRAEVAEVDHSWPDVDDDRVFLAVGGALNNLTGYPHRKEQDWDRYVSVPRSRLVDTLQRWHMPYDPELYQAAIRGALMEEWDPLGIAAIPAARDAYDTYVPALHRLLASHRPEQEIIDYLWWAETDDLGQIGNRQIAEHTARRLKQVRPTA